MTTPSGWLRVLAMYSPFKTVCGCIVQVLRLRNERRQRDQEHAIQKERDRQAFVLERGEQQWKIVSDLFEIMPEDRRGTWAAKTLNHLLKLPEDSAEDKTIDIRVLPYIEVLPGSETPPEV